MLGFRAPAVMGRLTFERFDKVAGHISNEKLRHSGMLSRDSSDRKVTLKRPVNRAT
jgi:hypothetical protein